MVTPELKWPITNLTPALTKLLATETPCLGSPTSSPTVTESFLPRMPPVSLTSAMACSAPCFNCEPKAASEPVIGPPTANLSESSFWPQPASASPSPMAKPSFMSVFIAVSPDRRIAEIQAANAAKVIRIWKSLLAAAAPTQRAGALIDPIVAGHHLLHPLQAEAQQ